MDTPRNFYSNIIFIAFSVFFDSPGILRVYIKKGKRIREFSPIDRKYLFKQREIAYLYTNIE